MACVCCGKSGCTNPNAENYDPDATCDDGSCQTCCTEEKCRLSDDCKGLDCNAFNGGQGGPGGNYDCCDSGCLPCGDPSYRDCHESFDNTVTGGGNFVATKCDNTEIIYYDCYECPTSEVVTPPP